MARGGNRSQAVRAAKHGKAPAPQAVEFCPLCIEPLDDTERAFHPCPCGYQVCLFCLDRLKLECGNLCPGCRTQYGSEMTSFPQAQAQKQRHTPRASPQKPEQPLLGAVERADSNPSLQARPSPRPRTLTPHIEHTVNGLRPASLRSPASPSKEPDEPAHSGATAPGASAVGFSASGQSLPQQPPAKVPAWPAARSAWPDTERQKPSTQSAWPAAQQSAAAEAGPSAASSQLAPAPELSPQPLPERPPSRGKGAVPSAHTAQEDPAVQWVFNHVGLERLQPAAPDPKGVELLQQVQASLKAGQISFAQGAEQLVAFIKQRSSVQDLSELRAFNNQAPALHASSQQSAPASSHEHMLRAQSTSNGVSSSIWGTSTSASVWPASSTALPSQSIWADAASPYTSAPMAATPSQGFSPAMSRLHSLWAVPSKPGVNAAVSIGNGGKAWGSEQPQNGRLGLANGGAAS
ncbi:hypothetical protein WJX73_008168 [Symbiochloris irregularis]|uniref:RING-type domain-containing protein n=1 Tax=Symbiochloris irregularis TaxID=706552 RepID=A0AAW1NRF5_9CHLO